MVEAAERFSETHFTLADPSPAMLEIAELKLADKIKRLSFLPFGTENIKSPACIFTIITAILSHHYVNPELRRQITKNCYTMLKPGGVYISFEGIKPFNEIGLQIGLERWRQSQLQAGKTPEAVTKHINRYGIEFLPMSIAEHLNLLRDSGFSTADLFWVSYLQAGFYAIK